MCCTLLPKRWVLLCCAYHKYIIFIALQSCFKYQSHGLSPPTQSRVGAWSTENPFLRYLTARKTPASHLESQALSPTVHCVVQYQQGNTAGRVDEPETPLKPVPGFHSANSISYQQVHVCAVMKSAVWSLLLLTAVLACASTACAQQTAGSKKAASDDGKVINQLLKQYRGAFCHDCLVYSTTVPKQASTDCPLQFVQDPFVQAHHCASWPYTWQAQLACGDLQSKSTARHAATAHTGQFVSCCPCCC
jgi:hypothetical protein